jgi:hypothetical protein
MKRIVDAKLRPKKDGTAMPLKSALKKPKTTAASSDSSAAGSLQHGSPAAAMITHGKRGCKQTPRPSVLSFVRRWASAPRRRRRPRPPP